MNLGSNGSQPRYLPEPALERIAKIDLFDANCAGHQLLGLIGNKWTILIFYTLSQEKKRYNEIKQRIMGISPKMLIQNLRNLERYGLVKRDVYPSVPPRVEYSLTPLGTSLVEPLAVLGEWAYRHITDVEAAVECYDSSSESDNYWEPK